MRLPIVVFLCALILCAQQAVAPWIYGRTVDEGGQGNWGSSAHVAAIADGSPVAPVTDPRPSVVIQRWDASQYPYAQIPFQVDATKVAGPGYFYPFRSFLRVMSPDLSDGVALSGGVWMDPSAAPRVNQTGWAGWLTAGRMDKRSRLCGLEINVGNWTDEDAPPTSGYGFPHQNTSTLGVQLVSMGRANSLAIETVGLPGPFLTAFKVNRGSARHYGLDLGEAVDVRTPIRLPQNGYLSSASTAGIDIPLVGFDGFALHLPTRVRMTGIPLCSTLPTGTLCRTYDGTLRISQ